MADDVKKKAKGILAGMDDAEESEKEEKVLYARE